MLERLSFKHVLLFFGFLGTLSSSLFLPQLQLAYFAPYLVITCFDRRLDQMLWRGALIGFFLDMASGYAHMGIFALSYTAASFCLFKMRRMFFVDSFLTLPVMSALFGTLSTSFLFIALRLFETPVPFSLFWFVTDLLCYPVLDGLFAAILGCLPIIGIHVRTRATPSLKKSRPV